MSDRLASMGIYDLTEGKGAVEEEGDYTQTNRKGIDELVKDMILFWNSIKSRYCWIRIFSINPQGDETVEMLYNTLWGLGSSISTAFRSTQ